MKKQSFFASSLISMAVSIALSASIYCRADDDLAYRAEERGKGIDLSSLIKSSSENVANGKALYSTYCASCHGTSGKGDGPAGGLLNPKPRNFTQLSGWTNGPQFWQMYRTLEEGITENGMASFSTLSPEQRINIIHYLRTLGDYPAAGSGDIRQMDSRYQLSGGTNIPGQIPVALAIDIMASDSMPPNQFKNSAQYTNHRGYQLMKKFECLSCHRVFQEGTIVGPSLYQIGSELNRAKIRESILDPDARTRPGFTRGVMRARLGDLGFYKRATDAEIDDIVRFLSDRQAPRH